VPEVSEVDVIRHFVRMSTELFHRSGHVPARFLHMKYNSRLNEKVARIPGFAGLHPLTEAEDAQGALEVITNCKTSCRDTGLPGIHCTARAHGEMTGVMTFVPSSMRVRAKQVSKRRTMLIPDPHTAQIQLQLTCQASL